MPSPPFEDGGPGATSSRSRPAELADPCLALLRQERSSAKVTLVFRFAPSTRRGDGFGRLAPRRGVRRRHGQATQIVNDVVEDEERVENERDDSPPPEQQVD